MGRKPIYKECMKMYQPTRDQLLNEGQVEKFLRYVQVDSPSSNEGEGVPSTPEQWDMAHMLEAELKALGLSDVKVDEHAIVTAALPGNKPGAPTIGFLAHYDVSPAAPAHGVKPMIHRNYDGSVIKRPGGPDLDPAEIPNLKLCIGHDLISSDGSTLLGADDKAGISSIMMMLCTLIKDPAIPHGTIRIGFTPDEETGRGVGYFDVEGFGAVAAYTIDGAGLGTVQSETFNARNLRITITGRSSHAGSARGVMLNAVQLASELVRSIPANMRPETSDDRLGFIHPNKIWGGQEEVSMNVLLRDFEDEGMEHKQAVMENLLKGLELRYPGVRTKLEVTGSYPNMRKGIDKDPRVVGLALEAVKAAGVEPVQRPVRGGTDGATLTGKGLPCPNVFDGSQNYHGRTEWVSVQWMAKSAEVTLGLVHLWAQQG